MGTTAGTVLYVNWHDNSVVRLLGGHGSKVVCTDWINIIHCLVGNWSCIIAS